MKENYLKITKQKKNSQQPTTKHQTPSGITLVALVITIIILLILAGVAISMITGGEGLFAKANNATTKYNQASQNEAEIVDSLLKSEYLLPKTNGIFSAALGMNTPDTSKLPKETTKYVTWTNNNGTYDIVENDTQPENWYDYSNGQWANMKTTNVDKTLEAYWVWIPRFAYKMPETTGNGDEKQIEVIFVKNNSKIGANGETCYYSTDTEITANGSGLYIDKTTNAMNEWIIHPAFTFGDEQLNGIWFAKFEASSSNPSASYGGGNVTTLKVQVKPGVTSWRYINLANNWEVCRAIQENGGVLGTAIDRNDTTAIIDTHMAKNMDWGAVAALSQSKYGIFNPKSATGLTENGGDNTLRVWNNPNSSYITGTVGSGADASNTSDGSCARYNAGNGPKGSSTGTVYGVYDMAGGTRDRVMGIMATSASAPTTPTNENTGFSSSNPWPAAKYYDIYSYAGGTYDYLDYSRGKIGDFTRELQPSSRYNWNNDQGDMPSVGWPLIVRGELKDFGPSSGIFAFYHDYGSARDGFTFRPVLICL